MSPPQPTPPRRFSRRRFLYGSSMLGAGALLGGSSLLAACGNDGGGGGTGGGGGGSAEGSLYFDDWPEYIDEESVELFREQSGVDFRYTTTYNDNDEYFAKIQPVLSRGRGIEPDILAPTFWMAARFIDLGWVQKLPVDQIPNITNLRSDLVNPTWDPTGEYTLPWHTGITGLAYNISATGREITSVEDLFDPAFSGRVSMLLEMRDTIGLILLAEGVDPATISTFDDAAGAFERLEQAAADGQIRRFTGNDYLADLNTGNFAISIAWSGDVLQLAKDNPDVRFVIPEEGGLSWADTMVWMAASQRAEEVAKWMDFVYDPENAARINAWVQFISPVEGVQEVLAGMGGEEAELAESPLLFPDDETLALLTSFANLSEEQEERFAEEFSKITGA
jgi:spermidine/putrescine transport system substrate-binding protein